MSRHLSQRHIDIGLKLIETFPKISEEEELKERYSLAPELNKNKYLNDLLKNDIRKYVDVKRTEQQWMLHASELGLIE